MRFIALVTAALAFAPAATAALSNPCALLTTTQAAKVLGSKIVEAKPMGNARYQSCKWTGANMARPGAMPAQPSLMVQFTPGETRARFEKIAEQTRGAVRLSGLGEVAYYTTGVLKSVNVLQHGYALFIVANLVSDPVGAEKSAAKFAVARL